MDTGSLELQAFRVHQHAAAIRDAVNYTLQGSNISDFVYAVRSRIKPVDKIVEKVKRKREVEKRDPYGVESLTDIVGFRFVVLFREDIIEVAQLLLRMIALEAPFTTAPFVSRKLREAKSYTAQSTGDPEAINRRLHEIFEQAGYKLEILSIESGYSSIHLVVDAQVVVQGRPISLPIEIQIRTVFEDAWGEIDHKLRYSIDRAKETGRMDEGMAKERLASWKPHLNALKFFVDGSALYAGLIRAQALAQRHIDYYAGAIVPVESFDEASSAIGEMSPELAAALKAAYDQMEQATKSHEETGDTGLFSDAVEKFKDVLRIAGVEENTTMQPVEYFAKMEQAYCHFSVGTTTEIDTAIEIYLDLEARLRKVDCKLAFRLGSALAQRGNLVLAAEKLHGAVVALGTTTDVPPQHQLRVEIPKRAGVIAWHRSRQCIDQDSRLGFLRRAMEYTRSIEKADVFVANNRLYYSVEYFSWDGPEDDYFVQAEVLSLLDYVERERLTTTSAQDNLNILHTLCRACRFRRDYARAKPHASQLAALIEHRYGASEERVMQFEAFTASLPPQVREMWEFALATLKAAEARGIK